MSLRWAVVCEAPADLMLATDLADRVLVETIDWLESDMLDPQRRWVSHDPSGIPLQWKSIPSKARALGIQVHGHFNNEPGLPDAKAARRALGSSSVSAADVDAVVLIRDSDDQTERRVGLEQARAAFPNVTVVIGFAEVERECWGLSGFEPEDDSERSRLAAEATNLGFDPRTHSHELRACKDNRAKKSPKRVLTSLTGGNPERERKCWLASPLAVRKMLEAD